MENMMINMIIKIVKKNIIFEGFRAIGGLKLDEIDATNSFLMLLMARNGLKRPFQGHLRPVKNRKN